MFSSSNSSSAKMICGLKVDTNDPAWFSSMTKVLKKIKGASYTIDAVEGMAYITGRANPTKLLRKLQSGKYANLCWVSAGNQITHGNGYHEGMQMQSPYSFNNAHQLQQGYWHSNHYHEPVPHFYPPPPPPPPQQRHAIAAYPYHHDHYRFPYGYSDRSMHHWL